MPTISTLNVDVTSTTSKFTSGLKIATAGLAALAAGAIYAFKQFEDSEKISKQTDAVLKSTGNSAHVTAGQVSELANAISQKTAIDDDQIQSGENMLLTFKNIRNEVGQGNDIFNQATQTITDMSVALGQDMKSSAIQLGKALNDPIAGITALQRVGVTFTEEQKNQIAQLIKHNNLLGAQKIILGELSSEFSGSAAAQKTASAEMGVALGNLAEIIGGLLAPALTFLADKLTFVVEWLQANAAPAFQAVVQWFQKMWEKVQPLAETIAGVLVPAFQTAWNAIVQRLLPGLKKLWDAFGPILKVVGLAAAAFGVVIVGQFAVFLTALAHVIDVLGTVAVWIKDQVVEPIIGFFQRLFDRVREILGNIKEAWHTVWSGINDFFSGIWDGIKSLAQSALNFIIGIINQIIRGINDVIQGLNDLNGPLNMFDLPKVPNIPTVGGPSAPVQNANTPIELHLHGDLSRLVDSVDEGLSRKKRSNVRLVHH